MSEHKASLTDEERDLLSAYRSGGRDGVLRLLDTEQTVSGLVDAGLLEWETIHDSLMDEDIRTGRLLPLPQMSTDEALDRMEAKYAHAANCYDDQGKLECACGIAEDEDAWRDDQENRL